MKLEAEGQRAIVDPQSSEIQSAVSLLSPPDRTFLILSRSGTSYIQVAVVDANRLVLECRDGSAERHFRSARDDFSTSEVVEVLGAYRRGGDSWWNEKEWRRLDVSARPDPWDRVSWLLIITGLILMLDAVFAFKRGDRSRIFGLDAMGEFAIAWIPAMASAIIDLRKFRTMDGMRKPRTIGMIVAGVLVITIALIEHFTAR